MQDPLIEHIRTLSGINPEDEQGIAGFFKRIQFKKKEHLQHANQPCFSMFFVLKGCLRMYFTDEKGTQHTTQFALEHWWLTNVLAFPYQQVTEFNIQAIESSEVYALHASAYEQLLQQHPQLERYFRIIYQKGFGASQQRMKYQHDLSREELYNNFIQKYPAFAQRIPQYMMASFLGFTPEYLSELRRKRS